MFISFHYFEHFRYEYQSIKCVFSADLELMQKKKKKKKKKMTFFSKGQYFIVVFGICLIVL